MAKKHLDEAKIKKDDLWFTKYHDVEKELKHYDFAGKIIYCNCSDWRYSNFYKYLKNHFHDMGLKKLYATGYEHNDKGHFAEFDGTNEITGRLKYNGHFADQWDYLEEADIICDNPPFSKYEEYINCLMDWEKEFVLLAPICLLGYVYMFDWFKSGQIRHGYNNSSFKFDTPSGDEMSAPCCWITTFETRRPPLVLTATYSPEEYPPYDNLPSAIEVNQIARIPKDYYHDMGVALGIFQFDYEQEFELVGMFNSGKTGQALGSSKVRLNSGRLSDAPVLNGDALWTRIIIRRRV